MRLVVRAPAVREDARAAVREAPGDRVADPGAAADAGDERAAQLRS
jgi:hypothetical protein